MKWTIWIFLAIFICDGLQRLEARRPRAARQRQDREDDDYEDEDDIDNEEEEIDWKVKLKRKTLCFK